MSRAFSTRLRTAWLLPLAFLGSQGAARGIDFNCNLAPNPGFENISSSLPSNWFFIHPSGTATVSLSTYPSEVQSGKYALKVSVTALGDINWSTFPESTSIRVDAQVPYAFSARLKTSSSSQRAALRIIEWNQSGGVVTGYVLTQSAATAEWQTLEGTFTPQAATKYVSLRLYHNFTLGEFIWDDIRVWKVVAGERCFDARHYLTQTSPGKRYCFGNTCVDGYKDVAGEFVQGYSNGILDYWSHTGTGGLGTEQWLSPLKDHGGTGGWSCFADPGDSCGGADGDNPYHPVSALPLEASLPVLTLQGGIDSCHLAPGDVDLCHATPGAVLLQDWQQMDVQQLDPNSGASVFVGTLWHRISGFILSSSDLQGDIGVRSNVAVFEYEAASVNPQGFSGGSRLERYFFVPGIGLARSQGRRDGTCAGNPTPSNCVGNYSSWEGADAKFNSLRFPDFKFDLDLPYVLSPSWWSQ